MDTPTRSQPQEPNHWLVGLIYIFTFLAFLPPITWLVQKTTTTEQLTNSIFILFFVALYVYIDRRLSLRPVFDFSKLCKISLVFCFVAIIPLIVGPDQAILRISSLVGSFTLFMYSLIHFVFGEKESPFINAIVISFNLFFLFAILTTLLDMPLRILAGNLSWQFLNLMQQSSELILYDPTDPKLLLIVEGQNYLVAPECNGFGVITSSLLTATMLVFYKQHSWLKKTSLITISFATALLLNALRILIIVLLAPRYPENYDFMHEIIGTATFIITISLILFIIGIRSKSSDKSTTPNASPSAS